MIEDPPLGIWKGRSGDGSEGDGLAAGESEMSPPWIMKDGIRRWKGVWL